MVSFDKERRQSQLNEATSVSSACIMNTLYVNLQHVLD